MLTTLADPSLPFAPAGQPYLQAQHPGSILLLLLRGLLPSPALHPPVPCCPCPATPTLPRGQLGKAQRPELLSCPETASEHSTNRRKKTLEPHSSAAQGLPCIWHNYDVSVQVPRLFSCVPRNLQQGMNMAAMCDDSPKL